MRIRFIEREDAYSVYIEPDGTEVFIAHGPGFRRLFEYDLDAMQDLWRKERSHLSYGHQGRREFLDILAVSVTDPSVVDEVIFCEQCSIPGHPDDDFTVLDGSEYACQSCLENYYAWCEDCNTYVSCDDTTCIDDQSVCDNCRARNYSWCEDCDAWYRDGNGCGVDHDEDDDEDDHDGCCESPAPCFLVPNDGNGPLYNDVITNVTLPSGTISEEGMGQIYRYLRDNTGYAYATIVHEVGPRVQTKEGTFTKRLSRTMWKTHKYKIEPAVLSQVGNIAAAHSAAVSHKVTVSRDLNTSARSWGHSDSCWWQSYYKSRCTLKNNGGFGLRSWNDDDDEPRVSGRAWVIPLRKAEKIEPTTADLRLWGRRAGYTVAESGPVPNEVTAAYAKANPTKLVPTFDALTPDAYIVFNGYGRLSDYTPARIMAYMAGMTYRKIGFETLIQGGDNTMYVNAGGYLIAPEELASEYTDGHLTLKVDHHSNLFREEQAAALNVPTSDKELVNA